MSDVSGLDLETQQNQWKRIKELMRDPATETIALGAFDARRLRNDYEMVKAYVGI